MGSSTYFLDSTEYLERSGIIDLNNDSFTLTGWVRRDNAGTQVGLWGSTSSSTLPVYLHNTNVVASAIDNSYLISSGYSIATVQWYFLTLTFDGGSGSGTRRAYIGSESSTLTETNTKVDDFSTAENTLRVHRWYNTGYANAAKIAYLRVYSTNLSLYEMQELMYKPFDIVNPSLEGDYPLLTDSSAEDHSGNGKDWTINGTPEASSDGPPVFMQGMIT